MFSGGPLPSVTSCNRLRQGPRTKGKPLMTEVHNIVLVHGGFVDGSGWRGVYDALTADGHTVRIVQNPTKSLADDAATTRDVLDDVDGPVVLVGHSYGGAVITEAGSHDKVA